MAPLTTHLNSPSPQKQTPEDLPLPMPIVTALAFIAGIVIFMLSLAQAHGATSQSTRPALQPVPPGAMEEGGLFFPGADGQSVQAAPILKTTIDADINGLVARYRIRHDFKNPTEDWTEAIYTFPLPDGAAVDRLSMTIGARVIQGDIQEKAEARRRFDIARTQGKKATLLEQARPNIFTTQLANIGPGETVSIEIGFQEDLQFKDHRFQVRLPLVVGPRYIPGRPRQPLLVGSTGWAQPTDQVSDADKITPPVRHPTEGLGNRVDLTVRLNSGFPIGWIDSPTHLVTMEDGRDGRKVVRLATETEPQDRDFVLSWAPKPGSTPMAGLFTEKLGNDTYALMMIMPPVPDPDAPIHKISAEPVNDHQLPRTITFVLDRSGSMHGASMNQAREALALAIRRLKPNDYFNVFSFAQDVTQVFYQPKQADDENKETALRYVAGLQADGGTEMQPALITALLQAQNPTAINQVILITDGAIGNEEALFKTIHESRGPARVFTVGIGSAPNSYLMTRAARLGQGSFTHINKLEEVGPVMTALFTKLENPVATDMMVTWPDGWQAESYPDPLPDLYDGEPVIIKARIDADSPRGPLRITGRLAGRIWHKELGVSFKENSPGIAALFGREKIRSAMTGLSQGAEPESVRTEVLATALKFKLLSRYTSLVAIDQTPARPPQSPLKTAPVPTNMPKGWSHEAAFGEHGAPMQAPTIRRFKPDQSQALRDAIHRVGASSPAFDLPQGATPAPALIFGGLLVLASSALMAAGLHQLKRQHP